MCGIAGTFDLRLGRPADVATLRRMASAMTHRGPDDEGTYESGSLGLAFRRLSIIDLAGGHQPMSDDRGEVWVAFNGEIYNFPELRRELERTGARFRTRSDTETIVHGYRRWGTGVLDRLNGMFGVAIWDERSRTLVVARDRAGIKPVYWTVDDDGRLLFASEVRAITAALGGRPPLDADALALFLRYRYTPAPLTLHRGIRKLAAGSCLVAHDGAVEERLWWREPPRPAAPVSSVDDAARRLDGLYRDAVGRQLISDVPVGLLLSGGVDSALLLSLMNEHGSAWRTYTVGFGEAYRNDELDHAAATAAAAGAVHTSVRLDRAAFEKMLPAAVASVEEPVASPSIVPMFAVCRRAREDVKVALVGQGPDELFCGYRRHVGVRYGADWRRLPAGLRAASAAAVESLPRTATLKRGVRSLAEPDPLERHREVFALLPAADVDRLFRPGALTRGDSLLECWAPFTPLLSGLDELAAFTYLELRSALPDELLLYGDKVSMHHSLEVRVPFLDAEVVDYGLSLPAAMKVRRGRGKWLHRQVAARRVPPEVLRRPKRGFAVDVVDDWFRSSLDDGFGSALLDRTSTLYEVIDPDPVADLVAQHRAGRADVHKILFSLVVAELWLRESGS